MSGFTVTGSNQENRQSWDKFSKNRCLKYSWNLSSNNKTEEEEKRWKKDSSSNPSNSTLSLHIAAYEDSIEAASNENQQFVTSNTSKVVAGSSLKAPLNQASANSVKT